jgi:hypothetical protein
MSRPKTPPPPALDDHWMEQLAWLMDNCIRIGPWSIGLDGLIGLIPGIGDVAGSVVSALIIVGAMQRGTPRSAILRMVLNVGIDSLVGSIPLAGDVFDFAFKANIKNVAIYRESVSGTRKPLKDWAFIIMVALMLLAVIALPLLALVYVVKLLTT